MCSLNNVQVALVDNERHVRYFNLHLFAFEVHITDWGGQSYCERICLATQFTVQYGIYTPIQDTSESSEVVRSHRETYQEIVVISIRSRQQKPMHIKTLLKKGPNEWDEEKNWC